MTPVSDAVRAAIHRADLTWLSAHLRVADCTPAVLRLLIRQDDPRLRHLGLDRLGARLDRAGEAETTELAALLPGTLDGPPETALLLATLHHRLGRRAPRPDWRAADLPVTVQIGWLRTEILDRPESIRDEPPGELLYQAVHGITAADPIHLEKLVRELSSGDDPILRGAALRLTRDGLHTALLAPGRARALITELLDPPGDPVAVAALRELAEPWAALAPFPHARLRQFLTGISPDGVEAAVAVAARHGHGDLLWDVVLDTASAPRSRQAALRALGDLTVGDDIGRVTAIAVTDPLLLGPAAVGCLRAMHRRGLFPGDADAAAVVDLALADHSVPAAEVAAILFTCRHEAFRALRVGDADDVTWPRRLDLLIELAGQGSGDLPVGETVTALLPTASRPEPFLAAIRALCHAPAEAAVLDVLPRSPEAALSALEAIGGPRTVAVLADGLGVGRPSDGPAAGVIAPHLRAVRHRALELLWHLNADPELRGILLTRLDPRDLPRRIRTDLGSADPRESALLAAGADPDSPVQALAGLARTGDATTLPTISALLARIVADLAASDRSDAVVRSDGLPMGEPAVPDEVVAALRAMGGRLHDRGKLRPFCLRTARDADSAGHALVATLALDLLDRADLTSGEQAILLGLLRQAPYQGTRARVHRLLRDRDRHVRKQAIAVLADGTGALSANLILLTAARDRQTVRQALIALGQIRARWAAPAIAACLGHPAMNVKKTAAEALVHAGTPGVVPQLLSWLGRHDNPGLRATLVQALRATLGDAYAATVLAAAEQAADDRTRDLLLEALDRLLSARAVNALAQQESPAASALLALIVAGRVHLGSGSVEDLAGQNHSAPAARPDDDIDALTLDGWDTTTARRIVDRWATTAAGREGDRWATTAAGREGDREEERPEAFDRLRPMLADWLRLAESWPPALRFVVRLCPAPWPADEVRAFARAVPTLVSGLAEITGPDRDDLLAILETVAPTLEPAQALDAVARLRAIPVTAAGRRSPLAVLRRCGAVLTRADVDNALAMARLGPDPWIAETTLLREAFTGAAVSASAVSASAVSASAVSGSAMSAPVMAGSVRPTSTAATAWRTGLEAAVRADSTSDLRAHDDATVPSRERLAGLIDVFPAAGRSMRAALLDWMEALQPIGVPGWTLSEDSGQHIAAFRAPHDGDLDQPRSAAQRARLLALLGDGDSGRRDAAAVRLRDWPEPEVRQAVLRAYLRGDVEVEVTDGLGGVLSGLDSPEFRAERVAWVAPRLDAPGLLPLLVGWWEKGEPAVRAAAGNALRTVSADAVAELLRERLDAGEWGFVDLIAGRRLLRTPELTETCRRLRADGRDDLADRILLVDGPLRDPAAAAEDVVALAVLSERPLPMAAPGRAELLGLIRSGPGDQIRHALTQLADAREDSPEAGADPELEGLLAELLHHSDTRVRLHAHRIGRRVLSRADYLSQTAVLLDDPEPGVVRSAVGTLSHAAYRPAIPAVVGLLVHPHPAVRRAAADGLVLVGSPAVPALTHAAGRARPDRRHTYTAVVDRIVAATD